jgi:hypothetical protein
MRLAQLSRQLLDRPLKFFNPTGSQNLGRHDGVQPFAESTQIVPRLDRPYWAGTILRLPLTVSIGCLHSGLSTSGGASHPRLKLAQGGHLRHRSNRVSYLVVQRTRN